MLDQSSDSREQCNHEERHVHKTSAYAPPKQIHSSFGRRELRSIRNSRASAKASAQHNVSSSHCSITYIARMSASAPRRIAQIVRLKRDSLQEYKACHAAVWPAVLQQIKDCNISDYSIYLDEGSMTLFASMKLSLIHI